jgi:hypothetical protein
VVLRQLDRFHGIPEGTTWGHSWAEWLYFNGRSNDAAFYLTFLVGPRTASGARAAGVRLQLQRGGQTESFSGSAELTDAELVRAPDLTIGPNSVRLDGMRYRIHLDVADAQGKKVVGDLSLQATAGRLVPPIEITGAQGWRTGYVVPVMSGALDGALDVAGTRVSLDGGRGYHDHNWGFWQGVSWQWGQAQQGDLSVIYGRVFPPPDAADPLTIRDSSASSGLMVRLATRQTCALPKRTTNAVGPRSSTFAPAGQRWTSICDSRLRRR